MGTIWIKGSNFKKVIGFLIPQILALIPCIFFNIVKIRAKTKILKDSVFANFSIKDLKKLLVKIIICRRKNWKDGSIRFFMEDAYNILEGWYPFL